MKKNNKNLENKNHWEDLGSNYSNVWVSKAKHYMDDNEQKFITKNLMLSKRDNILDIGVGNGRIINTITKNLKTSSALYGIDIAEEMINICKKKFQDNNLVKELKVCDISNNEIPYNLNFDFVTAIRVLKYNKNWENVLQKIYDKLNEGGIFVFCVLNENSLNKFARYPIPLYKTTKEKITNQLESIGFEVLETKTFTRIPDVFYDFSNNYFYVKMIITFEKLFQIILGKTFLGRIIFISVKK